MEKVGSQSFIQGVEPDVRRVFDALRWIVRALRLAQTSRHGGAGLSAAQVFVLHVLKEHGPLSVVELADRTATDPSSVSVVVRKLNGRGLVGKRTSSTDRRKLNVALTQAGARAAAAVPGPAPAGASGAAGPADAGAGGHPGRSAGAGGRARGQGGPGTHVLPGRGPGPGVNLGAQPAPGARLSRRPRPGSGLA